MALCGTGLPRCFDAVEVGCFGGNSLTRLSRQGFGCCKKRVYYNAVRRKHRGVRCLSSRQAASPTESEENVPGSLSIPVDEEPTHAMQFKMSDFEFLDTVSIGLGGRGDEVVYEAIVKDTRSPLYDNRVVLRRLTSAQAQRRGRRAIEVLEKLASRRHMYHSYSMQVHGYISSPTGVGGDSFILVHGYHGSFSLRHWFQQSDWLPTLEATLALDEESVRRVGDDTVGGPAVSRQLRLIRILMRDILIGVNYLHSHGLAHTQLRLENLHLSPVDRHIKVGILGNAADFYEEGPTNSELYNVMNRRQMMIAFDMRCVGFILAKMVLRELMDPLVFAKFKSFLMKGNDPSCLREFLSPILSRNSSSGNIGLQILDRNWGVGWNLLSLLLATKPSKRISCLDALRHPFLCGPRWRVAPSLDIIRWGLGSTAVRITEEYIYRQSQRGRLSYFVELMEMVNPHPRPMHWLELLPGKWRLLYSTGRQIGLTLRQPSARIFVSDIQLTVSRASKRNTNLSFSVDIGFTVMVGQNWPHDKSGINGNLQASSLFKLKAGRRLYIKEENTTGKFSDSLNNQDSLTQKLSSVKWRKATSFKEFPSSLPVAKLSSSDIELGMYLDQPLNQNIDVYKDVIREIRIQIPPEMFDLSNIVCGTYVDPRLLVLRGVNGSALLFTRSCMNESCR